MTTNYDCDCNHHHHRPPMVDRIPPRLEGELNNTAIYVGVAYIPRVEDGYLYWTNDYDLPNPDPVYIQGKDGASIVSVTIDENSHFIIKLNTGEKIDCGEVNIPQILDKKDATELPPIGNSNALYILDDKSIWRWRSDILDYECISRYESSGEGGSDKTYIHNQNSASSTWVVNHNLDKYPSVTVVDSANNVVIGEVTYNSASQLTIKFTSVFSGKAYLN